MISWSERTEIISHCSDCYFVRFLRLSDKFTLCLSRVLHNVSLVLSNGFLLLKKFSEIMSAIPDYEIVQEGTPEVWEQYAEVRY